MLKVILFQMVSISGSLFKIQHWSNSISSIFQTFNRCQFFIRLLNFCQYNNNLIFPITLRIESQLRLTTLNFVAHSFCSPSLHVPKYDTIEKFIFGLIDSLPFPPPPHKLAYFKDFQPKQLLIYQSSLNALPEVIHSNF